SGAGHDLRIREAASGGARDVDRRARAHADRARGDHADDVRSAMNSRERVTRALSGESVDRIPFAVWRHFYPDENQGAATLAQTTIAFTKRHRLDLVKYNPRAHCHAEPWGSECAYRGSARPPPVRCALGPGHSCT